MNMTDRTIREAAELEGFFFNRRLDGLVVDIQDTSHSGFIVFRTRMTNRKNKVEKLMYGFLQRMNRQIVQSTNKQINIMSKDINDDGEDIHILIVVNCT